MKARFTSVAVLFSMCLSAAAAAQQASPPAGDLSIRQMERRPVVLPKPTPDQMRSEAEEAVDALGTRVNMRSLVDQTSPLRPPARPDLDRDVVGGIQTRRLNDALRGR